MYLGYTKREPLSYLGSGIHWVRHCKKYGFRAKDLQTIVLHETENKEEIPALGKYYSTLFNVVKSKKWANEVEEIGQAGPVMAGEDSFWYGKTGDKNPMFGRKGELSPMFGGKYTLRGEDHPLSKKVAQIDKQTNNVISIFGGLNEANRMTGISRQRIGKVCAKKGKTAGGFKWEYATEELINNLG